ncbi:helix-turn-helix domain-containing protein, partial [Hazenella sp. IB182357]
MSVEIGSYLRQARESIGLTLEQLQEKTKIQESFLIAIEEGDFHKLPSPFYVRSYLRSYANCVKLEPHYILRQYRKEEQSQRLTGMHKVVTDDDIKKANSSREHTLKLSMSNQRELNQGQQEEPAGKKSLDTLQSRDQQKVKISANTALTLSETESKKTKDRRRRELERRGSGYQSRSQQTQSSPLSRSANHLGATRDDDRMNEESQLDRTSPDLSDPSNLLNHQSEETTQSLSRTMKTKPEETTQSLSRTMKTKPEETTQSLSRT